MKLMTTTSCCCCASLHAGCLIIGWLQLIGPLFSLIGSIVLEIQGGSQDDSTTVNFWGNAVSYVLGIIIAVTLLHGVYKNKKACLRFYIAVEMVILILRVVMIIILVFVAGSFSEAFALAIVGVIVCGVLFYCIVVVHSYSLEMYTET